MTKYTFFKKKEIILNENTFSRVYEKNRISLIYNIRNITRIDVIYDKRKIIKKIRKEIYFGRYDRARIWILD